MKLRLPILAALCALATGQSASAAAILRISEVMTNGDVADWFEITNYGDTAATLTGYRMDDESGLVSNANSVELLGVTTLGAGQSAIFIEGTSTTAGTFLTNWNLSGSVLVGTYSGSGLSFGSGGDSVVLFDNTNTEVTRLTVGAATTGRTFTADYDSTGALVSGPTVTASGMSGLNGSTALTGTPGAVPEPSSMLLGGIGALALLRRRRA